MGKEKKKKLVYEEFSSVERLLSELNKRKPNKVFSGCSFSSQTKGDADWYGTRSYGEAEGLFRNGDESNLDKIKDGVRENLKITKPSQMNRRRPENAVVGFAPNVPNAILGLPNSMITVRSVPQKVKSVTLVYNVTENAGTKVEKFLQGGVAVLNLINRLEGKGVRVRLVCEFYSARERNEYEYAIARVALKDWKDQLDLKKLVFPFTNASMLRRIGFKWLETVGDLEKPSWTVGYGRSLSGSMDYHEIVEQYNDFKVLNGNEYYITIDACRKSNFDVDELMKFLDIKK